VSSAWLRRSSRLIAALLLTISVWGLGHKPFAQDLCLPDGAEQHDASKHAFTAEVDLEHEHCAICHWHRFLRPTFGQTSLDVPSLRPCAEIAGITGAATRSGVTGLLAARAPPTTLL
jgi:hypothetical protein